MKTKFKKWYISIFLFLITIFSAIIPIIINSKQVRSESETINDLTVDIKKRLEWLDKTNGDAQITLEYASNAGSIKNYSELNVVIIQDKSGSMRSNYGFELAFTENHWTEKQKIPYPIRNNQGYSEVLSPDGKTDADVAAYMSELNIKDAASGYQGFENNSITNQRMKWGCTCNTNDHYYFYMSGSNKFRMIHGKNLQGLDFTDLHHYLLLKNADGSLMQRDDVVNKYLSKGYRVIRLDGDYVYQDENKVWHDAGRFNGDPQAYFLDLSQLVQNNQNTWILKSHSFNGDSYIRSTYSAIFGNDVGLNCTDRLDSSQEFLVELVNTIYSHNSNNKIAFVPFWGDVPINGVWSNASVKYHEDGTSELVTIPESDPEYTESISGVTSTYLGFTAAAQKNTLINEINNDFTYNGTNWSRAFRKAIELIKGMSSDDKEKETLVIFLTDGLPQGTRGQPEDYINPIVNAKPEVAELMRMDQDGEINITMYSCGICLGAYETTGRDQLNNIDSEKSAYFIRTNSDFSALRTEINNRLKKNYLQYVYGQYSCYQDVLSNNFDLDTTKLDSTWTILNSVSSSTTKGIPTDVYNIVSSGSGKKVYVTSTRTIYWYIGTLTNGSFSASGHSITVPIKYKNYNTTTNGADSKVASNTSQKLTYYSTQNISLKKTVSISTPQIIFNRDPAPVLTITKELSSPATTTRTFKYICSNTRYTSGIITDIDGSTTININLGQKTGTANITLSPGTYYVYEVDSSNKIINTDIKTITVSTTPQISTKVYSSSVPYSVYTSNNSDTTNRNNYLKITTTNANTSFTELVISLSGTKIWKDNNNAYNTRPSTYTVKLYQNNILYTQTTFDSSSNWQFINLPKLDNSGIAYTYTIVEDVINLSNGDNYSPSLNGTVLTNTLTGKTSMSGSKVWKDDSNAYNTRPSTYTVKLYRNGIYQKETSFSNNQGWSFTNLDKYDSDGKLYDYSIQENTITLNNGDNYAPSLNGTTLINTLTGNTSLSGTKVWKDNNNAYNTRPTSYTVKLYRNGTYQKETSFLNSQGWNFTNLAKYDANGKLYTYTIQEDVIILDNGDSYTPSLNSTILTNTLTGNTNLSGTKVWKDNNNAYNTRPASYTVKLYRNGTYQKETSFPNNQGWNFTNLAKYDINGNLYTYSIQENTIYLNNGDNYVPSLNGTVLTNTLAGTTSLSGTKVWKDNNNAYNTRPVNYTVKLYRNGTYQKETSFLNSQGWNFTNLAKYDNNGNLYIYTIQETAIILNDGNSYIPSLNGTVLTNTLTGNSDLTITKIWRDENNKYDTRPSNINISLLQNGLAYKTASLTTNNAVTTDNTIWKITYTVPKFNSEGIKFSYTIEEDVSNINKGYYSEPIYDQNNLTVINQGIWLIKDEFSEHMIIINKDIFNQNNQIATTEDFNKIKLDINDNHQFKIVLKQLNRTLSKGENSMIENYSGYSGNKYQGIVTDNNQLIIRNIPAGKYEISENIVQYFEFIGIEKIVSSSGALFSYENGKYYITISGLTSKNENIEILVKNKIIPERTYNKEKSKNNYFK